MKACDNTSVGVLISNDNRLLLIQRARPPFGWAPPAGHVDGDPSAGVAGIREVREETGLVVASLEVLRRIEKQNTCRRGGTWHAWTICRAVTTSSVLTLNRAEATDALWLCPQGLAHMAQRTDAYVTCRLNEHEWRLSPGLEPVWCELLRMVGVLA